MMKNGSNFFCFVLMLNEKLVFLRCVGAYCLHKERASRSTCNSGRKGEGFFYHICVRN